MDLAVTIILVLIGYIVIRHVIWPWLVGRAQTTTVRTEGSIQGPGEFAFEVVGESKYQQHLEHIAGGRTEDSAEIRKRAILALEDDNPVDSSAVCVRIDGLRVGYLSRKMARSYRKKLKQQNLPMGHYYCDALIVGGWDRGGGDRGHFGVRLDLPIEESS